jgi:hypothetical protein
VPELKTIVIDRAGNTDKQVAQTTIIAMPPWKIVLIRASRVYLMALSGLLTAAGIGVTTAVGVTMGAVVTMLQVVGVCMLVSLFPAFASAVWNTYELLKKWDETFPQMRA